MIRSLALGLLLAACGGQTQVAAEDQAAMATHAIPYGTYAVTASSNCETNIAFAQPDIAIIGRANDHTTGLSLPLPWRVAVPGAPRQDIDLAVGHFEYTPSDITPGCREGHVLRTVDTTIVNDDTLAVTYRELELDCPTPSETCTTTATYRLTERACAATCNAERIDTLITSDGTPQYTCSCS